MQGEGGSTAERKRNAADFALWKTAKPGEPSWSSPWGAGPAGLAHRMLGHGPPLLGQTFDIHGGGLDLIFPHHENEVAQSECADGKPMAKYWLHNGLLQATDEVGKVGGRATRAIDVEAQIANKVEQVERFRSVPRAAPAVHRRNDPLLLGHALSPPGRVQRDAAPRDGRSAGQLLPLLQRYGA